MILYIFIILFIKFPYMRTTCNENPIECKIFPVDDVDLDLKIPVEDNGPQCGEYGFRCLSKQIFEICQLPQDRHSSCIVELPIRRDCKEGFVCDEENPVFCTPISNPVEAPKSESEQKTCENEDDTDYLDESESTSNFDEFSDDDRNSRSLTHNECNKDKCVNSGEPIDTTTGPPETTTSTINIVTTELPIAPEFLCLYSGFHADIKNNSRFWLCETSENGEGFTPVHMTCKLGEIFNKQFHACIIPGVILECRNSKHPYRCTKKSSFTCNGKKSGKYSDKENCQFYHICVNNKLSPIRELLFICPDLTAYEPSAEKCTRKAMERCATDPHPPNASNYCTGTPSRFRQISDCQSYYQCLDENGPAMKINCQKGYKVDNSVMECLPERIAKCTPDENYYI